MYASLGDSSVTTVASRSVKSSHQLPLYGHWFGLKIYNVYLEAQQALLTTEQEISLECYKLKRSVLDDVSAGLQAVTEMRKLQRNYHGRGILSAAPSRESEVVWTGLCAQYISKLLFHDKEVGMLIHQALSRKRENASGNPELADWGIYRKVNHLPGDPVSFTDCKIADIEHASRTSLCHSINGVGCGHDICDWPVLVALPSTPEVSRLEIHIPVEKAMWNLPIVTAKLWDKALLCAFYYAVHTLLSEGVTASNPINCNHPIHDGLVLKRFHPNEPYEPRVFLRGALVNKFFDMSLSPLIFCPNYELIKSCGNLSDLALISVTSDERIVCLQYSYIPGDHKPTSVKQFIGALQSLQKLHHKGIVHGDVRAANIVFTENNSYLIDFDLARKVGSLYPLGYVSFPSRHRGAVAGGPMKLEHDRHSMAFLIKLIDDEGIVHPQVADMNIDLNDIIVKLNELA